MAVVMQLRAVLAVFQKHCRRRTSRRGLAEVVGRCFAGGRPIHQEPAAADVARRWKDDGQRKRGGDRGIDGGASVADHIGSDARCDLALRRDHPLLRPDRDRCRAGGD